MLPPRISRAVIDPPIAPGYSHSRSLYTYSIRKSTTSSPTIVRAGGRLVLCSATDCAGHEPSVIFACGRRPAQSRSRLAGQIRQRSRCFASSSLACRPIAPKDVLRQAGHRNRAGVSRHSRRLRHTTSAAEHFSRHGLLPFCKLKRTRRPVFKQA